MGRELLDQLKTSRFLPAAVLLLALAILGATVYLGMGYFRRHLRQHLISHDGEILHAVAQARQLVSGTNGLAMKRLQSPVDQLALALELSQLKDGVLAVRMFDADGRFVTAFPVSVSESTMAPDALRELNRLRPFSRRLAEAHLSDVFLLDPAAEGTINETPLIEVNIPLHDPAKDRLLAVAQLVLDGSPLEHELARLEEHLRFQALAAFLVGGLLLSAGLVWAYRRLHKANAMLEERTARLLRANHDLTLAAKTNAVGAVAAHLVHGLSNPLASLQDFMTGRGENGDHNTWQDALSATRRMQQLVHEVVRVLSEENGIDRYEMTLAELGRVLEGKVGPAADESGVRFEVAVEARGQLSNRDANLVLLILENLVHNALQVTPRNRRVQVRLQPAGEAVVCEVRDEGPGFPPELLPRLFAPCQSTKGGSGLGLAIGHQLAQQLGATLELRSSRPDGCVFALTLPPGLFAVDPISAGTSSSPSAAPAIPD